MTVQAADYDHAKRSIKQSIWRGVRCKCPSCGKGKLFTKWLKVVPECNVCGEELYHERAQDLPPYLTISIVGHIVVALLMAVEARWDLSLTVHLLIWIPLATILTVTMMQPVKGGVVGLQWAIRMFGFGNEDKA
ncbi:MAG: DUF983 domain-containing protein [Pseudomonadota bacterium]